MGPRVREDDVLQAQVRRQRSVGPRVREDDVRQEPVGRQRSVDPRMRQDDGRSNSTSAEIVELAQATAI